MISLFLAVQVAAAATSSTSPADASASPCTLQVAPAQSHFAGTVMFVCWSRAVPLGKADRFSSSYNPATRSTVVILENGSVPRVLVISPSSDNAPVVEDVTRDLAKLAGRYREAGLGGLRVDLSRFASEGVLSLSSASLTSPARTALAQSGGAAMPSLDGAKVFDATPLARHAAALTDAADAAGRLDGAKGRSAR